jgi:hypothetical protein
LYRFEAFYVFSAKYLLNLLHYGDLACQFFAVTVGEADSRQRIGVVLIVDIP